MGGFWYFIYINVVVCINVYQIREVNKEKHKQNLTLESMAEGRRVEMMGVAWRVERRRSFRTSNKQRRLQSI